MGAGPVEFVAETNGDHTSIMRAMLTVIEQLNFFLATIRKFRVRFFYRCPENPRDVPAAAGFLFYKAAVFGEEGTRNTLYDTVCTYVSMIKLL
jgi:hypothetical protein